LSSQKDRGQKERDRETGKVVHSSLAKQSSSSCRLTANVLAVEVGEAKTVHTLCFFGGVSVCALLTAIVTITS